MRRVVPRGPQRRPGRPGRPAQQEVQARQAPPDQQGRPATRARKDQLATPGQPAQLDLKAPQALPGPRVQPEPLPCHLVEAPANPAAQRSVSRTLRRQLRVMVSAAQHRAPRLTRRAFPAQPQLQDSQPSQAYSAMSPPGPVLASVVALPTISVCMASLARGAALSVKSQAQESAACLEPPTRRASTVCKEFSQTPRSTRPVFGPSTRSTLWAHVLSG